MESSHPCTSGPLQDRLEGFLPETPSKHVLKKKVIRFSNFSWAEWTCFFKVQSTSNYRSVQKNVILLPKLNQQTHLQPTSWRSCARIVVTEVPPEMAPLFRHPKKEDKNQTLNSWHHDVRLLCLRSFKPIFSAGTEDLPWTKSPIQSLYRDLKPVAIC